MFSMSLAPVPGAKVMLVILTQIHVGFGGASLAPEHAAHPVLPGLCSTHPSSSAVGWKSPSWCLHHLLFALFEFLFAFTSRFLFLRSCLGFVPSCIPTLFFSFVFSVLLVSTLQPSICSPPSHPQSPPPASNNCGTPASGVVLPPLPQASAVSSAPIVSEPAGQSPFLSQQRARETSQFLHRHSASELPKTPGSSPPSCPNGRTVMPGIRRTSLSPPPLHPSHFPFPSHQPLRGSSLSCSPQSSASSATNAPSLQRGDILQPRGPTILPVIPVPPDRAKAPTDKAGCETSANVPLNGHPEEQIALGPPGTQVKSVDGPFFPHLGAAPCSLLPTITSPPSSSGQAPSPSCHVSSCPAQQWCQPVSQCLPLPPPHAAVSEVAMPRRTPPYMTSSAIAHLSKY